MNHKQKIGYTILGAFIMLIGMWIGNSTSPPLIAQSNGEITCKQLTFVSETGLPLFTLQTEQTKDKDSSLYIRNRAGKKTMELTTSSLGNSVFVYDRDEKAVVLLHGLAYVGGTVYTKFSEGEFSTSMRSGEHAGQVTVYDKEGETVVKLSTTEHGGTVDVYGKDGKGRAQIGVTEYGGRFAVYNNQGKNHAAMGVNEYGNGAVSTWDKNGYRQ